MVNAKEEAKRRIDEWKAPDYCKSQRQQKCFFLGLLTGIDNASGGQLGMVEYADFEKQIKSHRKKRTTKPKVKSPPSEDGGLPLMGGNARID